VGRSGTLVFWGEIWCTLLINVQGQSMLPGGEVNGYEVSSIAGNHLNQNVGFLHVKSQGSLPVARLSRPDLVVEFDFMLTGPSGWTWNYARPDTDSGASQTCAPFGQQTIWCTVRSSPQHMRPYWYVALGDSYSAGTGTAGSESEPSGCHRTATAYPSQYRDVLLFLYQFDVEFTFVACHGATTETMYAEQLTQVAAASLGGYPDLITVTIGGNDLVARDSNNNPVGFSGVLKHCLIPAISSCSPTLDVAAATDRLDFAYRSIRQRSGGNTTVQVLQYPQVLPSTSEGTAFGCPGLGRLDDVELPRLRALWHQADQLILTRALAANDPLGYLMFEVVFTENAFAGHELCSSDPWAVDLTLSTGYNETAFHPNTAGHSQEALYLTLTQ